MANKIMMRYANASLACASSKSPMHKGTRIIKTSYHNVYAYFISTIALTILYNYLRTQHKEIVQCLRTY